MSEQNPPAQQKRILLVEDDQYIRDLYVSILEPEPYAIDTAVDGNEAYTKMVQNTYELILLDIMLPKMSGIDILEKLQNEQRLDITKKVVLLTNLSQESIVARAVTFGIRGYIVKSDYTPDQILQEVKNHLS
jgi:CheY-like chemotaxis protein